MVELIHHFSSIYIFKTKLADVSILQADVTLADNRYPIPILGQPPLNMSDLTLEDFLLSLINSETGKGIKFDFKSTKVVEPAFRVLARHSGKLIIY